MVPLLCEHYRSLVFTLYIFLYDETLGLDSLSGQSFSLVSW